MHLVNAEVKEEFTTSTESSDSITMREKKVKEETEQGLDSHLLPGPCWSRAG